MGEAMGSGINKAVCAWRKNGQVKNSNGKYRAQSAWLRPAPLLSQVGLTMIVEYKRRLYVRFIDMHVEIVIEEILQIRAKIRDNLTTVREPNLP